MPDDDDRAYAECLTCCCGFSATTFRAEQWADDHESETGHRVKVNYDD